MSSLFDNTTKILQSSISYAQLKHQVIAGNIANVDTPGYKAMNLQFENILKDTLSDASKSCPQTLPEPVLVADTTNQQPRLDGNTVDPERQMASLTRNTISYNGFVQLLNAKFRILKTALGE